MAATKGGMTSMPTSQTIFLPTVEDAENNRINFRDSLKFFQEQLVINGASFPSPSSACRAGNDTLKKNGSRSCKEQSLDNDGKEPKDCDIFEGEMQSVRGCKISIPTVDTILESVRVLRAIQKSQKERGSNWNLDITSKADIETDFSLTSEWIQVSDINQDVFHDELNHIKIESTENMAHTFIPEMNGKIITDCTSATNALNTSNEDNSFWPSNSFVNESLDSEKVSSDLTFSVELKDEKAEFHIHGLNTQNLKREELIALKPSENTDKQNDTYESEENGFNNDECKTIESENISQTQISETDKTNVRISFNTPDSLSDVCKDILKYVNVENPLPENAKGREDSMIGILKIETYEDVDPHKEFLLNDSVWKGECSPNDSSSTKLENNDSDSGVGTQRSASSLSPNIPNQMQKDSWSDTCSSQYASAECSPYHSLNSVFDSSVNQPGFEKEILESSTHISNIEWEDAQENAEETKAALCDEERCTSSPIQSIPNTETGNPVLDETHTDVHLQLRTPENVKDIEQDTEGSYCFVSNYTLQNPISCKTSEQFSEYRTVSEICDTVAKLPMAVNGNHATAEETQTSDASRTDTIQICNEQISEESVVEEDSCDTDRLQKFTAACDLISIVESLYSIKESPAFQVLPGPDEKFEETLCILSEGAFCEYPEDNYLVRIEDSTIYITKNSEIIMSLNMKYGELSIGMKNTLKVDNRMGRCLYIKCDFESMINLKTEIELHCLKHWQTDCLQLVHYPLKYHQNVVIIDLGSCSTRAGILMDQPTLPSIFFPTICATDRITGTSIYGMEALQPEVRQHSNLSFPVRPSIKITKHTIDIELLKGLFVKIFADLNVDPTEYTIQVCLPRNLSISAQNALVKLLLENLKVKSVSLTNQALLTLYAHDVSTAVVVDIGDRTEVLPVVDGFIVESGVTKLPHGGQRLIHHMKHGLAEKHVSLSSDVDSFVVQYIIENLAYVASDYENEMKIALQNADLLNKTITLQPSSTENSACKRISLEEARFKICEGLFDPELWGLDSPGIHYLVNKAIQATGVDVRKRIAENIYVSGGVTMLPGFAERLNKEVAKLSKAKIVPKVIASNYRYHCTYIGACKFAKMEVFPQVCISLEEYSKNSTSALKKCALCF